MSRSAGEGSRAERESGMFEADRGVWAAVNSSQRAPPISAIEIAGT
jgi:hypothetical protein